MIKRILALRYVCKKYNLKYIPKLFGDVGWICTVEGRLCVSLLQKNFYDVLYHEVGHLVADRSLKYKVKYLRALAAGQRISFNGGGVFVRLQEEATASKFSLRVAKKKDKDYLKRAWYTYTGTVAKVINADELDKYVTTVAKYNKYFEGNTKC